MERLETKAGFALSRTARLGILAAATTALLLVSAGSALAVAPPNDNRASAEGLNLSSGSANVLRDNVDATIEGAEAAGFGHGCTPAANNYGATAWFTFSIPAPGTVTIRTVSINEAVGDGDGFMDPVTTVFPHGSATAVVCNDDDPASVPDSKLTPTLGAGSYDIQVGGFAFQPGPPCCEQGDFQLLVDYAATPIPPPGSVNGRVTGSFLPPTKRGKRKHKTRIKSLTISAEVGSTVAVSCSRCSPRQAAFTIPASGQLTLSISGLLRRGTVIEVRITKPGLIGYLKRYTTVGKPGNHAPPFVECAISTTGAAAC